MFHLPHSFSPFMLLGLVLFIGMSSPTYAKPPNMVTAWEDSSRTQKRCAKKAFVALNRNNFETFFDDTHTIQGTDKKTVTATILCWKWGSGSRAIITVAGEDFSRTKSVLAYLRHKMN